MKRIEKNKMLDNQLDGYPDQNISPLNISDVNDSESAQFRFLWASGIIDDILNTNFICRNYLDIGACDGYMSVLVAKKNNANGVRIHADAIEPHNQSYGIACETAKNAIRGGLSMTVYNALFEDYKTSKRYEIITAFEILEHSKDPVSFIEKIYNLLETHGCFLMSVPEEHGAFGINDNSPFHYWAFTAQSLVKMFDENKWHVYQVFEYGDLIHAMVRRAD